MTFSTHFTMTAGAVTEVAVSCPNGLEVVNRDGSAEVYVSLGGADPTVGAPNTLLIPAAIGRYQFSAPEINAADGPMDATVNGAQVPVRLISSGSPKVSVRGW